MANQKGETTSIGHFYNRCVDAVNNLFDTMSFWTHSKDVEFVDGKNAETKVGAINGITSDMSCEDESIAISAKAVNASLVKLKNQSVTFTNGFATFFHESIKTTSIIIVQNVSGDGRGATAIIIDVNEVVNYGSVTLKAYDAYNNKNHSGNLTLNILICN